MQYFLHNVSILLKHPHHKHTSPNSLEASSKSMCQNINSLTILTQDLHQDSMSSDQEIMSIPRTQYHCCSIKG